MMTITPNARPDPEIKLATFFFTQTSFSLLDEMNHPACVILPYFLTKDRTSLMTEISWVSKGMVFLCFCSIIFLRGSYRLDQFQVGRMSYGSRRIVIQKTNYKNKKIILCCKQVLPLGALFRFVGDQCGHCFCWGGDCFPTLSFYPTRSPGTERAVSI